MSYVIDKGVPVPTKYCAGRDVSKWPFNFMDVGDSFLVADPDEAKKARQAAATKAHRSGWKFASRKEGGGLRIWRTE